MTPGSIGFGIDGNGLAMLGDGWGQPEAWGTWNEGSPSVLNLHVDPGRPTLELEADGFVPSGSAPLDVAVSVDGQRADTWRFEAGQPAVWRRLPLPDVGQARRQVRVTFDYSVMRAPADWGASSDARRLAMAVRQARVVPAAR